MFRHASVLLALSMVLHADATRDLARRASLRHQQSPDAAHILLRSARSVRCSFDTGTASNLAATPLRIKHERPLPILELFDAIDRNAQSARYITDAGASEVKVIAGKELLSFLDVNPATGSLGVTSVFPVLKLASSRRELLAVSSIHSSGFPNTRMATQHFGACVVLQ